MTTRRQILKLLPAAGAAGALLALTGRIESAEIPAMSEEAQRGMTPDQALAALKAGNERFVTVLRDLVAGKRLRVFGAMHDVGTGRVSFFS